MSNRQLWVMVIAVAVVAFVAGVVLAQEGLKYPYLPAKYSESYTPTLAEWEALNATACYAGETCLTARIVSTGCVFQAEEDGLMISATTRTQPGWDTYLGKGRFSCTDGEVELAYAEAAEALMRPLYEHFPGFDEKDVRIEFWVDVWTPCHSSEILPAYVGAFYEGAMHVVPEARRGFGSSDRGQ